MIDLWHGAMSYLRSIFFFFVCGCFFVDFFFQAHLWCYMIFAIDVSSFLKEIDGQNNLCILKYGGQNLAWWCLRLWSLWTAFTCCCPLSWLSIWLQSEVVYPCFIQCHIFAQNPFLLRWNSCEQRSASTRCCFWLTVTKRGIHFKRSFLIDKF